MLFLKPTASALLSLGVVLHVAFSAAPAHALEPQKKPHQENRAQLMVDVVFGLHAAHTDYRRVLGPSSLSPLTAAAATFVDGQPASVPPVDTAPVVLGSTQSLLFAGIYALRDSLHVGARAAITLAGGLPLRDGTSGTVAAISNTELEGEHLVRLTNDTEASFGFALILPTAQGHEPEDDLFADQPAAGIASLHGELSEAAAAARGFEDGALFRAERVGLIPKVHLAHHKRRLRLESQIKLENLLSIRSSAHHSYLGELVVSGFYGYDLLRELTLGVRLWSSVLLEATEDSNLICEPQLQIHGAHIQGLVGALIPLVQRPDGPTGLTGVRLAAAALF